MGRMDEMQRRKEAKRQSKIETMHLCIQAFMHPKGELWN